ncbi:oxygenase MpaB family protein [Luteipulveratus mongoliensis]|uniref:ER-bound oxygenase mpaB/mpaB'/Rubber oxygenase catalytic domain-containing protein n=1 Tax=Luteipulveratus mongoliensis TaxID=571913 RepID=A0A0K1JDV9_9MICO|nr:oxygenase MpaB family protein [Luteipulveratus mongoliensis]AKU14770.1 hypothetical protein VV02_00885 [Luteipulveratus mongoliensis]
MGLLDLGSKPLNAARRTGGAVAHLVRGHEVEPAADYGFFGPDSVAWKVWAYPTSLMVGFSRAVTVEELDPLLVASVDHSGQVKQRPYLRYDRTLQYFATVMFADAETVLKSSEILMKIHSRAIGIDPETGQQYDANDPESQLWIHLTAWHSILYAYEVYGPGRLSAEEEARYWEDCAVAAEFQTIDPDSVPRTREGIRQYFEDYRPQLIGSEVAQDMFQFLANGALYAVPPSTPDPIAWLVNAVVSRAVIATLPKWMREMGGTPQSRVVDIAAVTVAKPAHRVVGSSATLERLLIGFLSPKTAAIVDPVLANVPAINPRTYTPAEARKAFGHSQTPREIYADILAEREHQAGPKPYAEHHHDSVVEFAAPTAS